MKSRLILPLLLVFIFSHFSIAQTVEDLYIKRDFKELIKFESKKDELSKEELYYVGYAFFQLENDKKAIEMYDMAISKGLDDDYIYLYKALSLMYDKQIGRARDNFRIAINRNPTSQKNYNEMGNSFYFFEELDSALVYFQKARNLEYELGDPYLKLPNIYHVKQNYEKALEEYKVSASLINKEDPVYLTLLSEIGLLEYTITKNFNQSIKAYQEVISLQPDNYDLYPKLIKAYYAKEDYTNGDSLIAIMKTAFEQGKLSEEYQKYKDVAIAEFEWNNQKVLVNKSFVDPKETLDIMYKIYLLSSDGKSVERTLMTEQTIQFDEDGAKHLLCEREKDGTHYTYNYGWSTDNIDFSNLKEAAIAVFDKKISPGASSKININSKEKKSKKKKKRKRKN